MATAARAAVAPFRQGNKAIYLPTSIFTLVRGSGRLAPNQALFHVPLNVNKFDIRDYLYGLYGLVTTDVRVMVQQSPLQSGTNRQRRKGLHMTRKLPLFRPQSTKRAIVTMDRPFTYPDPPKTTEELEPWQVELRDKMRERQLNGRRGISRGKILPFLANGRV